MSLSASEISRIARLARLELSPDEERVYADQLGRVVDYIDQIAEIEATLPPAPSAPASRPPAGPPRADEAGESLDIAEFLRNAPAALDRFLVVPQVK